MKKSTKGALAAAAAGSLLVGGAGSLAYWTGEGTVSGAEINAGEITMGSQTCTGIGLHDWQYADTSAFAPATSEVVPGDSISKVCSFTLTLAGDHIAADLSLDSPTFDSSNGLTDELTKSATFTIDGDPVTSVSGADIYDVVVTVSVDFPDVVEDNDSQGFGTVLENLTVTATQA